MRTNNQQTKIELSQLFFSLLYRISGLKRTLKEASPKKRLLVKLGERYSSVKVENIAWFIFDEGITFACSFEKKRFPVNYSINQLSSVLNQDDFFRINRKCILNYECIRNIHAWFNSRLKLRTEPSLNDDPIVSRDRVKAFKQWLDR